MAQHARFFSLFFFTPLHQCFASKLTAPLGLYPPSLSHSLHYTCHPLCFAPLSILFFFLAANCNSPARSPGDSPSNVRKWFQLAGRPPPPATSSSPTHEKTGLADDRPSTSPFLAARVLPDVFVCAAVYLSEKRARDSCLHYASRPSTE